MVYVLRMVSDFLFGGFCTKADEAAGRGIILDVVRLSEAKRGFVLLPRR